MRWAPALLLLVAACATPPRTYRRDVVEYQHSAIARVRAGAFKAAHFSVATSYLADRETRLCFFLMEREWGANAPVALSPVDCCALYRAPRMRAAVPWLNEATCPAVSPAVDAPAPPAPAGGSASP